MDKNQSEILSQDEVKTLVSILSNLHFLPEEARLIISLIDKLKSFDKEPDLVGASVSVDVDNLFVKINK